MKDQDVGTCRRDREKETVTSRPRGRHDRKGWMTHRISDRDRLLRSQKCDLAGSLVHQGLHRRSSRRINLNKGAPHPSTSSAAALLSPFALDITSLQKTTLDLKRKSDLSETALPVLEQVKGKASKWQVSSEPKKQKQSSVRVEDKGSTAENNTDKANEVDGDRIVRSRAEVEKERERQRQKKRDKKRRQKSTKQTRNEEQARVMEESARHAEAEISEPTRFLVGMPLASIGSLSGRSVCRHFRKRDLMLNDILPVPLEALLASVSARSLYESLKGPIYFSISCMQSVVRLKERLKNATVCSKLLVVNEEHFNNVVLPGISLGDRLPRLLGRRTLAAIEQALEDSRPPHVLESSQNAEDKIKCLFNPILRSLDLQETIITTGFSWKEKIGLRSSIDLGTHNYGPKSDAAIIKVLNDKEAKLLIVFEAYSKLGQSSNTPDDNMADRVRLLIQGSYISIRDAKPSVVFYLSRDKYMETILIFSEGDDHSKFGYYAEKQPFYSEVAWVDLVCQIINLV